MDDKYDILRHPDVVLTTDGKAEPYQHGGTENAVASVALERAEKNESVSLDTGETNYELLSDEDIEEYFKKVEEQEHEKGTEKESEEK